jgi:glutaconate CoA-transferase subunit B
VEKVDFITSVGHGDGASSRRYLGLRGRGPSAVITDLAILEPDAATKELTLVSTHPGVSIDDVRDATGWDLKVAATVRETSPPTSLELSALRELKAL